MSKGDFMPIPSIGLFDAVSHPPSSDTGACTALKAALAAEALGSGGYDIYLTSSGQRITSAVLKQTGLLAATGFLAYVVCNAPTSWPHTDPDGPAQKRAPRPPFTGIGERVMLNDPLATNDQVCAPEGQYQRPVRIEQTLPEPWGIKDVWKPFAIIIGGLVVAGVVATNPEVLLAAPAL